LFGESHIYMGEGIPFDPEGLFSTPAAIVQVVFGYFTGQYIQQKGKNYEMLSNLFVKLTISSSLYETSITFFPLSLLFCLEPMLTVGTPR